MNKKLQISLVFVFLLFGLLGCDFLNFNGTTDATEGTVITTTGDINSSSNDQTMVKVTFVENMGTDVEDLVISPGSMIQEPAVSRIGFIFGGWFTDSGLTKEFDFKTQVNEDLTLYAKWSLKTLKVSINFVYGEVIEITIPYGITPADFENYLDEDLLEGFAGFYLDSGFTIQISPDQVVTTDLEVFVKDSDILYIGYNNISELDVTMLFNEYALTIDGQLYTLDYDMDSGTYFDFEKERFVNVYLNINDKLDLEFQEVIVDVIAFSDYIVMLKTSLGRTIIYGENYENIMLDNNVDMITSVDLDQELNLDSDEEVVSGVITDYHIIISTNKSRVFFWGIFPEGELDDNVPLELTNDFNLAADEYFIKDSFLEYNGVSGVYYRTNKRFFVRTEAISYLLDNTEGLGIFEDANKVLNVEEKFVVFIAYSQEGYGYITESGLYKAEMTNEVFEANLPIDEDELILDMSSGELMITDKGNLYQFYDYDELFNYRTLLPEDEYFIKIYNNGESYLASTNKDKVYVLNYEMITDITDKLQSFGLTLDSFVNLNGTDYLVNNGAIYYVYGTYVYEEKVSG
ncbi:MAG: InlB B-repeat-containing protein, partial [Candidatus Izemoplasmatales bacterium]|nr:InlB B-repeat-containing protein [Candidatus Izemoplasmatales bacterium]